MADHFPRFQAIFVLLDCEDPLFACLEKKDSFAESLVNWISGKVLNVPNLKNEFPVDGLPVGEIFSVPFPMEHPSLTFCLINTISR